jgi:hypothetical protein
MFSGRNRSAISLASLRIARRGTPGARGCSYGGDSGDCRAMKTFYPDRAIGAKIPPHSGFAALASRVLCGSLTRLPLFVAFVIFCPILFRIVRNVVRQYRRF